MDYLALLALCYSKNDKIAEKLLDLSGIKEKILAAPDAYLFLISFYSDCDRGIKMLYNAGAKLDTTYEMVNLAMIASAGNGGSLRFLLDHGIDPYETDEEGNNILDYASQSYNFSSVIKMLRKTHWLADGMKATDSECDDRMLAINP